MRFAIDVKELRERAAVRAAKVANSANRLTEPEQNSHLAALATSHAPACTEIESQLAIRRDRLMRSGWSEQDATAVAQRLARRDQEQDDRIACAECTHFKPCRCASHQAAALQSPEVSRDLATLLQRCPGFELWKLGA